MGKRNIAGASAPAAIDPTTPVSTGIGVDTAVIFTRRTTLLYLQNNSGANLNYDFDTAATAGSPLLATGQSITLPVPCSALHLLTAAAQHINGATAANIVVRGWVG